jgi:outer membrane protein assembly factor BamB
LSALLILFSCSRGPKPVPDQKNNNSLSPFTVTVIDRSPTSAIIRWETANNILNSDSVLYKVKLDNRIIDSNLNVLTDTLHHLVEDTSFVGRVYAYTKSGDTASAPFYLELLNGYMYFGQNNVLSCVDAYTGIPKWQSQPPTYGDFKKLPTVANGMVFANTTQSGTWAFNANTGEKIWNTSFPNEYNDAGNTLLYANGTIYTTIASYICALNSSDGTVRWRVSNDSGYFSNPVLAGNHLILAQLQNYSSVIALDAATGKKIWSLSVPTQICINPVVYDSLVIFSGSDQNVYAINHVTGKLAWKSNIFSSPWICPVIYKDLVIVYSNTNGFVALQAATGAPVWKYFTSNLYQSSPAIGNDMVFIVCSESPGIKAIALDAAKGTVVWKHLFDPSYNFQTPIFGHNRLYFSDQITYGKGIDALSAITGDEVGFFLTQNYNYPSPMTLVIHDTTYYPAESGMVQ